MSVLIIDNYDSFTYNLKHYVEQFENEIVVKRNNEIELIEIANYDSIILSPGPGLPEQAGITLEVIREYANTKKILGVCLGHQAIAVAFGAKLKNLNQVLHGMSRETFLIKPNDLLFENIPNRFNCGRYHSWVIDNETFPSKLEITAVDHENNIMALRHKEFPIFGVQFHPESILSEYGLEIIRNWCSLQI
jgi:anthranilate synthase component II